MFGGTILSLVGIHPGMPGHAEAYCGVDKASQVDSFLSASILIPGVLGAKYDSGLASVFLSLPLLTASQPAGIPHRSMSAQSISEPTILQEL